MSHLLKTEKSELSPGFEKPPPELTRYLHTDGVAVLSSKSIVVFKSRLIRN